MAYEFGPPSRDLTWLERLIRRPTAFDFDVALRRFDVTFPGASRLGEGERAKDECIRLGQTPSSSFEPTVLSGFTPEKDGRPGQLTVGFLGLWGPNGPLPGHLTDYARERSRNASDNTLIRFVDIFHHRILTLFHRAWAQAQPTVSMDRPQADAFARYVGSLFGLGTPAMRGRDASSDHAKLYFAGRLGAVSRNADGLRDLIADHTGVPTRIEEFVGQWLELPEDARWRLGVTRETGTLGKQIVLGARAWSRTNKFRVVLGPLDAAQFESMLPSSEAVARLTALVRLYTNDEWEWELRLVLAASTTEPMRLGRRGRLGWTTRVGWGPGTQIDLLVDPAQQRTQRVRGTFAENP
jgi:type VI secretion system protein ImpH